MGGSGEITRAGGPTITFSATENGWQPNQDIYANQFGANARVCNGIVHSVNVVIKPNNAGFRNCPAEITVQKEEKRVVKKEVKKETVLLIMAATTTTTVIIILIFFLVVLVKPTRILKIMSTTKMKMISKTIKRLSW